MRFATLRGDGPQRAVVVSDDGLHPLDADLNALVALGLDAALEAGSAALRRRPESADGVRWGVPLQPPAIRDFVAFEEHVQGVRRSIDKVAGVPEAWYDAPTFYFTNPHRLCATGDEIAVPGGSVALDFECEVGVVVGRAGSDLTPAEGEAAIFGYTVINDWSARDLQSREMQVSLGPCKGKDFALTLGPWIVTADEFADRKDADGFLDLACTITVNGSRVGFDLTSHIGWTFGTMVAYASRDSRVVPGDVLGSGTVGNGGCLAELWGVNGERTPPPLLPGDEVTIEIEGIGAVTNTIVPGRVPVPLPRPRLFPAAERAARRAAR